MADATAKLTNPDFYVKMAFIFAGVAVLYVMRKRVFRDPAAGPGASVGMRKDSHGPR